jgi:AcrR family transcriptional regulator
MTSIVAGTKRMSLHARRAVILRAATEVVAAKGAEAASISDVADRAGITRPVVYDHFPTKRDLLVALVQEHHETFMRALAPVLAGGVLDRETLRDIVVAYLRQVDADPGGWRILCLEPSSDPKIAALQRRGGAEIDNAVAQLLGPRAPLAHRRHVATAMRAAVNALADVRQRNRRVSIDALADAAVDLLWEGAKSL